MNAQHTPLTTAQQIAWNMFIAEEAFWAASNAEDEAFAREERETKAWNAAHQSLADHLHDLGCNVALMAWSPDEVTLDAGWDDEGAAAYAQLAEALGFEYSLSAEDRSEVNAWLEREYNERYEEALEAATLTLAA